MRELGSKVDDWGVRVGGVYKQRETAVDTG